MGSDNTSTAMPPLTGRAGNPKHGVMATADTDLHTPQYRLFLLRHSGSEHSGTVKNEKSDSTSLSCPEMIIALSAQELEPEGQDVVDT